MPKKKTKIVYVPVPNLKDPTKFDWVAHKKKRARNGVSATAIDGAFNDIRLERIRAKEKQNEK